MTSFQEKFKASLVKHLKRSKAKKASKMSKGGLKDTAKNQLGGGKLVRDHEGDLSE